MSTLTRLLGFLGAYRRQVALAIALGSLTVAANMGLLATAAYLIAAAALKPLLLQLTLPIYAVRLLGVSRALARYAERLVSHSLTFRLLSDLRTWFYGRLEPLAPARLLAYRSGDLLARVVKDVDELENLYLRVVAPVAMAALVTALTVALLHLFSATLAWAALAFLLAGGVGVPLLAWRLSRRHGAAQVALRTELDVQIVDDVQGLTDLLACGQGVERARRLDALGRDLGRVQRRMAMVTGLHRALSDLVMNAAVWTMLVLAIPLVSARRIDGVYLAFLTLLILSSFEAVQPLGQALQFLGHALEAGRRIFDLVDARPAVADPSAPRPLFCTAGLGLDLEFENVCFAYGAADGLALDGISFSVPRGHRVAIVGPSGAGKSTLARLLLRFWDPAGGVIRLGGAAIDGYSLADLRQSIGLVAQDTHLFNDTMRGNLLMARPEATDAELEQALALAQLLETVRALPEGLDTWVGEQGQRLSGGERQRLAIARALLKDAPLLVLDEPTANLDPLTERALLAAIERLMRGRTTLLITHRLVEMESMDEIIVLDHGHIVERGSHHSLLAAHGLYRAMVETQDELLAV